MKRFNYKNIEAFVFRLWTREISKEKISEKEDELLNTWRSHAEKNLDETHMQESKKESWPVWSIILLLMKK
ncbi:hypothetical protein [Chryseobacterium capnotolerans]|uniref:hypothetical protein n=1 Tax=Chryseobacterium capnotolerans TaxID=2759528 RepID=UPI001E460309|nr:hypothetical protein [Chryseobacterium capnotolerans]